MDDLYKDMNLYEKWRAIVEMREFDCRWNSDRNCWQVETMEGIREFGELGQARDYLDAEAAADE